MEINLENNILQENKLEKEQNKFLDSALGSAINNGIDIGIRCLCSANRASKRICRLC